MATPFAALRTTAPLARWWTPRPARERRAILIVGAIVVAALGWWMVWQPLRNDIVAMGAATAHASVALADARRKTEEMAGLARAGAQARDADPRIDLERVLVQQNLRAALTQQDWKDGRARLVFGVVGYDALIAGLEALQRDAHLRVVEATLTARVEPGTVRAEVVLSR
jgi:type II secretory pathway component PulM